MASSIDRASSSGDSFHGLIGPKQKRNRLIDDDRGLIRDGAQRGVGREPVTCGGRDEAEVMRAALDLGLAGAVVAARSHPQSRDRSTRRRLDDPHHHHRAEETGRDGGSAGRNRSPGVRCPGRRRAASRGWPCCAGSAARCVLDAAGRRYRGTRRSLRRRLWSTGGRNGDHRRGAAGSSRQRARVVHERRDLAVADEVTRWSMSSTSITTRRSRLGARDTGGGNDRATLDDNWARTTVNGGNGEDRFQVGQIFKSERDARRRRGGRRRVLETIQTTRGFLSNGVSSETTHQRRRRQRRLRRLPQHGRRSTSTATTATTSFTVRAFALEGSTDTNVERRQGRST